MLEQHSYTDINAETWDQWARDGIAWSIPVSHEVFQRAQAGQWDVILTASRPVPHSWFGELAGKRVLGLASGGGQQIPILCARGAVCTVLCPLFLGRTIWGAALLLAVVFANLLYADLRTERGLLSRKPAGH